MQGRGADADPPLFVLKSVLRWGLRTSHLRIAGLAEAMPVTRLQKVEPPVGVPAARAWGWRARLGGHPSRTETGSRRRYPLCGEGVIASIGMPVHFCQYPEMAGFGTSVLAAGKPIATRTQALKAAACLA